MKLPSVLLALAQVIEEMDVLQEQRRELTDRAAHLMSDRYEDKDVRAVKYRIKKARIEVRAHTRRGFTAVRVRRVR